MPSKTLPLRQRDTAWLPITCDEDDQAGARGAEAGGDPGRSLLEPSPRASATSSRSFRPRVGVGTLGLPLIADQLTQLRCQIIALKRFQQERRFRQVGHELGHLGIAADDQGR